MDHNDAKNISLNKRFLFATLLFFLVASFIILIFEEYSESKRDAEIYTVDSLGMIDQRMDSLLSNMNNFPRSASNDVLFLSNLSCLEEYMNSKKGSFISDFSMSLVEKNFLRFLEENTVYDQLRYIDEDGYEKVRVNYNDGGRWIVKGDDLQNKKDRYYFKNTMILDKGGVYISPLDLNIENGIIENRGSVTDPKYIPMMRYSTPVFNHKGERKGIVISNVNADYFLEDVRRFQGEGELTFLINKDGYYLAHPDNNKEFGFAFGNNSNIDDDYPGIAEKILLSSGKGRIETEDKVFSFWRISPTLGSLGLSQGALKTSDGDYYWILVNIADKKDIGIDNNTNYDVYYTLSLSGIVLVVSLLAYLIGFRAKG